MKSLNDLFTKALLTKNIKIKIGKREIKTFNKETISRIEKTTKPVTFEYLPKKKIKK